MHKSKNQMDLDAVALALKALSNPTRLRIFLRVVKCCSIGENCGPSASNSCVSEMGRGLNIALSTLSHHIKELRQAGLVTQKRNGRELDCCVNYGTFHQIVTFFNDWESVLNGTDLEGEVNGDQQHLSSCAIPDGSAF